MINEEIRQIYAPAPGYHANVRTTSQNATDALDTLRTYHATPVRVWS